MPFQYGSFGSWVLLAAQSKTSYALVRFIGDPTDGRTQNVSWQCGGHDQLNFATDRCAALMRCVLDRLSSDTIAGFQSGGAIVGFVPTMLALVAASPMELVQLAFLSPHRALATACFGIGLPVGLFRQLRAASTNLADFKPGDPCTREWIFHLPSSEDPKRYSDWRSAGLTVILDVLILGLTGVALWFNYRVSSRAMITWRCEYGLLVFMWPMACVAWLLMSVGLLWAMSFSICAGIHAHGKNHQLSILQLTTLPYLRSSRVLRLYLDVERGDLPHATHTAGDGTTSAPVAVSHSTGPDTSNACGIISTLPRDGAAVTLEIRMPSQDGMRSWRWYEAIIETLAVGIYLYATFVLTSTQFLSGNTGLTFVTIMALSSSVVRILESIFWWIPK